jgi:hypothetical protein
MKLHEHIAGLRVAGRSGSATRWSIGLRGPSGEQEITIQAVTYKKSEASVRAIVAESETVRALQLAHKALHVHGDDDSIRALEAIEAALAARRVNENERLSLPKTMPESWIKADQKHAS